MGLTNAAVNLIWRFLIKYYSDDERVIARLIGSLASQYFNPKTYLETFRLWEEREVHITPVRYSYPIPDTRYMSDEIWLKESKLCGLKMNEEFQLELLTTIFPKFKEEYNELPHGSSGSEKNAEFHFENGLFDGTDALALYCMNRHFRPNTIIEVGSGFSSKLSAKALQKNNNGSLICIEPFPSDELKKGFPRLAMHIQRRVEHVDLEIFQKLDANDILFIDSSHIVKIGGDVTFLFLEVIPNLRPGVIIHVHDIFFPNEYPRDWVVNRLDFWSEQYLLQAFLSFNDEFEVLLSNSFLGAKHKAKMMDTFPKSPWWGGSSFWFRRKLKSNK